MKNWTYLILPMFLSLSVLGATPLKSIKIDKQLILTAFTEEYPEEYSEIYVNLDKKGLPSSFTVIEYEKDKKDHDFTNYSFDQINSSEGAVLKKALTVSLLILKGTDFNKYGGTLELRYRKSNWSDDYQSIPMHFTRNAEGKWLALAQDSKKDYLKLTKVEIKVWKGLGFGIDKVTPIFEP